MFLEILEISDNNKNPDEEQFFLVCFRNSAALCFLNVSLFLPDLGLMFLIYCFL